MISAPMMIRTHFIMHLLLRAPVRGFGDGPFDRSGNLIY
jgi:hypothetical protein